MKKFVSITISDSRSLNSEIPDLSGQTIIEILNGNNFDLFEKLIIPDDKNEISQTLEKFLKIDEVVLILTTGGTGISKRDVTPEATEKFIEKNIPGIPEMIRSSSFHKKNSSIIYRGLCGISNDKIILNLPGSPEGVKDGIEIAMKVLPHILEILDGKKGH